MTHQGPRDPRSDRHGSAKTTCVACCAKNKTDPDRKFCCDARNSTPGSSDWEARLGLLRNYMTQPLVELYGGCMVVLKVPWCGIGAAGATERAPGEPQVLELEES
jgi:hypothetical protein